MHVKLFVLLLSLVLPKIRSFRLFRIVLSILKHLCNLLILIRRFMVLLSIRLFLFLSVLSVRLSVLLILFFLLILIPVKLNSMFVPVEHYLGDSYVCLYDSKKRQLKIKNKTLILKIYERIYRRFKG